MVGVLSASNQSKVDSPSICLTLLFDILLYGLLIHTNSRDKVPFQRVLVGIDFFEQKIRIMLLDSLDLSLKESLGTIG